MIASQKSLRAQVVNWLLILFCILLLISFAVSYVAAVDFANLPYDRQLLSTARALASHVRAGPSGPQLDLPESVRVQLLEDEEDQIRFLVTTSEGADIGGTLALPPPSDEDMQRQPELITADVGGTTMRLASTQHVVTLAGAEVRLTVQVAETINKRTILARQIFFKLLIPQIILAALPIGGLWLGVGSGLAPLERLKQALVLRQQYDLSPLLIEDDTPDELRPLIEAFNEMLARMENLLASQRRFVADAAHQLRTPLAGLKTQAELALRLDDAQSVRQALRQVLAAAERGSKLASQLLTLARHEQGAPDRPVLELVDLNRIVQEAAAPHVESALRKNIDLGFEPHTQAVTVHGEAVSLGEMVSNLIDNAVRYTQENGRITASVSLAGDRGLIMVEDNGPGIPLADRPRVFERFYRGLGTNQEGSGLGLAIVQEIARLHGADISCDEGADGEGAIFRVSLPLYSPSQISAQEPYPDSSPVRALS